ncbi:hexamerin-1.1-like [Ochlerotatus camptorhynchus]|uniref:hexamerin-1.1-like n=1 Tax=Ochlerotatus camptorhynchus TaxID=644619 RepID=UPI0031D6ACBF
MKIRFPPIFLVISLVISCTAFVPVSHASSENSKYADKELLLKQKFFFEILRNIYQPLEFQVYLPYTKTWIEDESKYKDFGTVSKFFDLFKAGFLEKGEIFTIYNYWYLKQTRMLFQFFYNSIGWDTYHKNVIWARENVNEGMFIFALTLSVLHRKDLEGIILPSIYELDPYLFFNGDLINDAMLRKLSDPEYGFYTRNTHNVATSNYTSKFATNYYGEGKMAYFTEDIGLNAYYYYFMLEYPSFLGGEEFGLNKDRRGELFLYMLQQLLARYYLERESNSLGAIEELTWEFPLKKGHYPMLRYWNGIPVRSRENSFNMRGYDPMKLQLMKDHELRIRRAIDTGYYNLSNGTKVDLRAAEAIDIVGNMVNGNVDSIDMDYFKSMEVYARMILAQGDYYGSTEDSWPGSLMHYETSMRDPIFYQFLERMLGFYWQFKNYLPPYSVDELSFRGVQITGLTIDQLITYFDNFEADISNGLPFNYKNAQDKSTWDFIVFAQQKRLNHKPFNYTMTVMSNITKKGVVRMYMGPKFQSINQLQSLKKYYVEMDQFLVDIVTGENIIKRSTNDFYYDIRDRTTYTELYKRVMRAIKNEKQFVLDLSETHCGWPDRLLLPRGLSTGYEITFFFIITPYQPPSVAQYSTYDETISCGAGSGSKYTEDLPFGFPFDRELDGSHFMTKNMLFKDVTIYHFNNNKLNETA